MSIGSEPSDLDPQIVTGLGDARVDHSLFEPLVSYEPVTFAPKPALRESWDISRRRPHLHLSSPRRRKNGAMANPSRRRIASTRGTASSRRRSPPPNASLLYVIRGGGGVQQRQTKDFSPSARSRPMPARSSSPWRTPHRISPNAPQLAVAPRQRPRNRQIRRPLSARHAVDARRPARVERPFVLKEWNAHQHILVEKSPTYYDRASVRLNAIRFYPTDNIDAEERAFRAGQLHATWALPLSKIPPLQREHSPALRIDPYLSTYFSVSNVRKPPLDDVRVRRALALSIDRQLIADKSCPAAASPRPRLSRRCSRTTRRPRARLRSRRRAPAARGRRPPGRQGSSADRNPYNNSEILRQVSEAIQQMWHRDLGVDVRLVNQEFKGRFREPQRRRLSDSPRQLDRRLP